MKTLNHFSIPIWGLKIGVHQFDFQLNSEFFNQFEDSIIKDGNIKVLLNFDKRSEMFVLDFDFQGNVATECDRCLEPMNFPLNGENQLMVKFAEEESEQDEVHYISKSRTELNVAKYIYEFVSISMPIIKTHDDEEGATCNEEMLKYLSTDREQIDNKQNPFKEFLNKFKK